MKILGQELTAENWKDTLNVSERNMEQIVMFLGLVKRDRKLLDKIEGFLLENLASRRNEEYDEDFGEWHVKRTLEAGRLTPDKDKIVEEMGEEWWLAHQKKGEDYWKVIVTEAK